MTVDLGTATTYNVISSKRAFLGGFILPGVQTSLRAISSGTAQLPPISPETPDHLIGRNTVECLNNGVMFGTAAMLDGLAARVEAELGEPLTVVATGGLAPCIMPCCTRKVIYDSDLFSRGWRSCTAKTPNKQVCTFCILPAIRKGTGIFCRSLCFMYFPNVLGNTA